MAKTGKLPDFLIIGGMKCGSTSLYDDLSKHPSVHFPDKEASFFSKIDCLDEKKLMEYKLLFSSPLLCGDCSTHYSMLPTYSGVANRARKVLDENTRLIYMVRNPIERAISHHHHLQARGATSLAFSDAIIAHPEILSYSDYATQLRPWSDTFPSDSLLVLSIERYNREWDECVDLLFSHLGLDRRQFPLKGPGHSNQTGSARVFTGRRRAIYESSIFRSAYQNGLRSMLPQSVRSIARKALLPKPPAREIAPPKSLLCELADRFSPAVAKVSEFWPECDWDLEKTVESILNEKR